ncbi:ABC transporter ATP-binding protein [Corynebacterium sp. TAE3-ERU16]|uniref:ABC transporter ATP-binding protein n=1 Tax=Corynebacterium sp. TAE3-ERU16 TaxID=2849493 RepID=UPI001C490506|nr:ABC transporter ATP-binding protein [Corynebacterium sp. TAE3-ERU16]MBV7292068.1 ABC transporter ATP-binding protein/permease [Corynebacterium sp. TAE3-ERU16]
MSIEKDRSPRRRRQGGLDFWAAPLLLARYLGGRTDQLLGAVALGIAAGFGELLSVWAIWRVVVVIVDGDGDPSTVWRHVVLCGVGVLGRAVAYSAATALAHLVAFHTIAEIRLALGGAWVRRPVGELRRRHSSTAKTLALDSCEKMELFIAHVIPETAAAVTVWISVTVWLFTVDWRMTVAAVALVPVAFATMLRAIRGNGHRMGRWLEARTAMEAAVLDLLTALPVIRVFNRTGAEHRRTADTVRENARLQSRWGAAFVRWGSPFSSLVASTVLVITPVGTWLLYTGDLTVSGFLLFVVIGPAYPVPLVTVFHRMVALPMLAAGATAIETEFAAVPDTGSHRGTGARTRVPGDLRPVSVDFDSVSFSHEPGSEVLHNLSFRVPAGSVTAIVGDSGAGKSTVIELIAGFHAPDSGKIRLGGRAVDEMEPGELSRHVAAVFQKPYLIAGSIRDNICLARPDADDATIAAVAHAAAVDGFVEDLPEGLETVLGESGAGLSGGQRQRIAVARALLADRPVLLLDEASAATDPDNEAAVHRGLNELTRGRTVIVVAHRLHTIRHADNIIVLDGGTVAEQGTHDELIARGGRYAVLWGAHTVPADAAAGRAGTTPPDHGTGMHREDQL